MRHLLNLFLGFTAVASTVELRPYPRLSGGFAKDKSRLRNDARQVGRHLNREAEKVYGNQKHAG